MSTNEDGSINSEIERLLNKRVIRKGRGLATEYLVRWKEYGPEFNQWYNIKDLDQAPELVKDYKEEVVRIRAIAHPTADASAPPPQEICCCYLNRGFDESKTHQETQ